jgi:hypothetical protein
MLARKEPDLSPGALCRIEAGMTKSQLEKVIGRYHRPNLYEGRRYYAWIGKCGMLRAFFDGPRGTLSSAVLDVPEEQRQLTLQGNVRSRRRNCTINRIWYCIPCRKRYRCSAIPEYICPLCQNVCEAIPIGIRVPSRNRAKAWCEFWLQYLKEKTALDAYSRGELSEDTQLTILRLNLTANAPHIQRDNRMKQSS